MLLKSIEELIEHIFFWLLSHLNVWVVFGVVPAFQIFNVYEAITVLIKFFKSESNNSSSSVIHVTNNSSKEFIIVDFPIAISIK